MRKIALVLLAVICVVSLCGCSSGFMSERDMNKVTENPEAVITLEYDNKVISLVYELRFDKAPITVVNFIELAESGFYNDTFIHYVSSNSSDTSQSYIMGGSYAKSSGSDKWTLKKKDYYIKGEFKANKWEKNDLTHELGSLVMNRTSGSGADYYDTASTDFYISTSPANTRQGNYAVFGVLKGSYGTVGSITITRQNMTEGFLHTFFQDVRNINGNTSSSSCPFKTTSRTLADGTTIQNSPTSDVKVTVTIGTHQTLPKISTIKKPSDT